MGVNHRLFGPPRICGAASAPAESMNTMVQPEAMPGLAKGMTTNRWICHEVARRLDLVVVEALDRAVEREHHHEQVGVAQARIHADVEAEEIDRLADQT